MIHQMIFPESQILALSLLTWDSAMSARSSASSNSCCSFRHLDKWTLDSSSCCSNFVKRPFLCEWSLDIFPAQSCMVLPGVSLRMSPTIVVLLPVGPWQIGRVQQITFCFILAAMMTTFPPALHVTHSAQILVSSPPRMQPLSLLACNHECLT